VVCEKAACPVLNCPSRYVDHPVGACCPLCRGSRQLFLPSRGSCVFRSSVLTPGATTFPDLCTKGVGQVRNIFVF
jgi:hypothetical protein